METDPNKSSNDVFSEDFESKMDKLFCSDWKPPGRYKPKARWNGVQMGRGMMPSAAASDARRGK